LSPEQLDVFLKEAR
jgi:hypothetical protein